MLQPFEHTENLTPLVKRIRTESTAGATNVTYQEHKIGRKERAEVLGKHKGFRGCTIWFTGLSGAGKTTLAFAIEKVLNQLGLPAYGLDGDNVRHGLCKNLGFSKDDRKENIRRVAEVAKLFADMGVIALAAFISPYKCDREEARAVHTQDDIPFFEVYVNTSLEICELRDPKKLYKKARAGELKGFTGIDSTYEVPDSPNLVLKAGTESEVECIRKVLEFLHQKDLLPVGAYQKLFGSSVRELFIGESEKQLYEKRIGSIPKLEINQIDLEWLQVLSEGWATPLAGFMRERQYLQCLHHGLLLDLQLCCTVPGVTEREHTGDHDAPWSVDEPINQSIPIVLPISDQMKHLICNSAGNVISEIALSYKQKVVAILCDGEVYVHRKHERVARQFGTVDARHPVVNQIMQSGDWLLGGDIKVFEKIVFNDGLDKYRLTPMELRQKFAESNCDAVFAFQLRNPIHNGHALLMQDTRSQLLKKHKNPMLLLHPLGGWVKDDDVPLHVRIKQHEAVIDERVLDPSWTVLSIFPSPMLYAGPTEVQWHARARLAAGITTYIVGRDPAGIPHPDTGDYLYDPTHGSKVLSMAPGLKNLEIIQFRVAAYDKVNGMMAFYDESRKDDFFFISGTKMRSLARDALQPPEGFMAPKAWKVLSSYYQELAQAKQESNVVC